ncbi:MAG: energy-coupling factor transporter ATPase [Lachnospiraceae bacterium]|nr:energy-coupling factor transporter ATPase [Lachnospiraceae bacterium]
MSIEIKNLTYVYNKGTIFAKTALDNINLTILDGEFIGLIGHTGSGKSTLIQHLNALLIPTEGYVYLNGEDINKDKSKLREIRQRVGLVFQYPEHQLFEMTVFKDVSFGPSNMGLSKEEVIKRTENALKMVGLPESLYEKSPFELSGGEKRRAAIAGILAMNPEVIILDEPTAGLDPKGRDEILNSIKLMHDELGITVILVSHSMEDVAKLVNRIIVMDNGEIALSGSPKEVFSKVDILEKMGLAAPQISYVFKHLKEKGYDVPLDVYTTKEATEKLFDFLKQVDK